MLNNEWQLTTKRWGHPLHSMCAYVGMFSPRLPHYFIQKFTRRGDVVLDPFCGRGTTPLQACMEGRIGIGIDPDPLAHALTLAKVNPPDPVDLRNRIDDLSNDMFFASTENEPPRIRMLFHPETLSQLVYLKQSLHGDDPTDAFIIAVILGILHGGAQGGSGKVSSFLSIPMPNAHSMSSAGMESHIHGKNLDLPPVDVFACLRQRINSLLRFGLPQTRGRVWKSRIQDLADIPDAAFKRKKVKLIISSPPPFKGSRHGLHSWIRLWFLGEDAEAGNRHLDQHRKMKDYLLFMQETSRVLYRVLGSGGTCALVISDVPNKSQTEPIHLADEVWAHLQRKRTKFKLVKIIEDELPRNNKAGEVEDEVERGRAAAIDRVLVLHKDSYEELQEHVAW